MDADTLSVVRRPTRLRALAELAANAESSAQALDRIAQVACRVLGVPVALVNLIGSDEQRFVGCSGGEPWTSLGQMPITAGFCPFTLASGQPYAIDDTRADPALADNPAVRELGVVAYAGVPLRTAGGEPIGTLCALDYEPREWGDEELELLSDLSAAVIAELQLLAATRLLARQSARVHALADLSAALAPAETPADVLREVSRSVDRLDVSALWLSMVDEPAQTLRTAAASGADSEAVVLPDVVPLTAPTPPAEVVRTGRPEFLATRTDVRDRFAEVLEAVPEAASVAVVPLSAGPERLGVLGVCFADEGPLAAADQAYLAALGGVSALALARDRR